MNGLHTIQNGRKRKGGKGKEGREQREEKERKIDVRKKTGIYRNGF